MMDQTDLRASYHNLLLVQYCMDSIQHQGTSVVHTWDTRHISGDLHVENHRHTGCNEKRIIDVFCPAVWASDQISFEPFHICSTFQG